MQLTAGLYSYCLKYLVEGQNFCLTSLSRDFLIFQIFSESYEAYIQPEGFDKDEHYLR